MSKNQLHSFWPVLVGEFFNPEHLLIKDELINFLLNMKKIFLKEIVNLKIKIILEIIISIKANMIYIQKKMKLYLV